MFARSRRDGTGRRPCQSRRGLLALPLAVALGLVGQACASTPDGAVPAETPARTTFELVCRKPSGEPLTLLEVLRLDPVLRGRLGDDPRDARVRITLDEDGQLPVVAPGVASEAQALALRPRLQRPGHLLFTPVAHAGSPGWDPRAERARLESWWEDQAAPTLEAFNALARDAGGPPPAVRWLAPHDIEPTDPQVVRLALPCGRMEVVYPERDWVFTASDLDKVYRTQDMQGWAAVGFEIRPERQEDFTRFTEAYVDEQIAIVLDGAVLSAPVVNTPLTGPSIIQGRFTDTEVDEMVWTLRGGALPVPLELVEVRRVTDG